METRDHQSQINVLRSHNRSIKNSSTVKRCIKDREDRLYYICTRLKRQYDRDEVIDTNEIKVVHNSTELQQSNVSALIRS